MNGKLQRTDMIIINRLVDMLITIFIELSL